MIFLIKYRVELAGICLLSCVLFPLSLSCIDQEECDSACNYIKLQIVTKKKERTIMFLQQLYQTLLHYKSKLYD
jgi:hypothetical protein